MDVVAVDVVLRPQRRNPAPQPLERQPVRGIDPRHAQDDDLHAEPCAPRLAARARHRAGARRGRSAGAARAPRPRERRRNRRRRRSCSSTRNAVVTFRRAALRCRAPRAVPACADRSCRPARRAARNARCARPSRKRGERVGAVEIAFDELDAGGNERRIRRPDERGEPVAAAQLRQRAPGNIAAADDEQSVHVRILPPPPMTHQVTIRNTGHQFPARDGESILAGGAQRRAGAALRLPRRRLRHVQGQADRGPASTTAATQEKVLTAAEQRTGLCALLPGEAARPTS